MFVVYCQFPGKQAEAYEFPEETHFEIANGNIGILNQAGIHDFNRVTVDDRFGFREVWSKRQNRQSNNNNQ